MSKALLKAAAAGQTTKLEGFLDGGADIDFADKAPGRTALIEAVIGGHADAVRLLVARGAKLNATDRTLGYTALGWAAHSGNLSIVEQLLAAGASVEVTASEFQLAPLMVAAQTGRAEVIAALLAAGADLHRQTGDARNALSMAEGNGHAQAAALLRRHGAQAPIPPAESTLPWPVVADDLADIDDADPASVLRGFILAMHRWETECARQCSACGVDQLDWTAIQQSQARVFDRYCTPKPRPQGRAGSFSASPDYTPQEALIDVEYVGGRATLMTRKPPGHALRYEAQYVLVRKNNRWRVDNKKTRPWGTQTWATSVL
jgi:hypothetical protein